MHARGKNKLLILGCGVLMFAAAIAAVRPADAAVTTLQPDGDVITQWGTGGVSDSTCSGGHCSRIDEAAPNTGDFIASGILLGGAQVEEFSLSNANVGQGATQITVHTTARSGLSLPPLDTTDTITVQLWINGSYISSGSSVIHPTFPGWATFNTTFTGTWSQSDIDTMRVRVTNNLLGLVQNDMQIAAMSASITYTPAPQLTQSAYRAYHNAGATVPGAALAATNTAAELPSDGAAFRLRLGLEVAANSLPANYQTYKLQAAARSGSCDSGFIGESYSDINAASGAIRWHDNPGAADGAGIGAIADDPVTSGAKTHQSYRESNPFGNPVLTPVGNTAIWDFALRDAAGTPGDAYCFRLVKSDGSLLDNYSTVPEVLTVGSLSADMVDNSGASVANPSVAFGATTAQTGCQQTTAVLGTAGQRLRITNDLVGSGWTASIAPTAGASALWNDGAHAYDFNDSSGGGCTDGGDIDSAGGQLTVNPSSAVINPKGGCGTTGLLAGGNAGFIQGSADAITLITASSAAPRFCYWDITGIGLGQTIPAGQAAGAYALELTITVIAQ